MTYNGFGDGSDGAVTLSGTDAPVDSSCSGTGATKTLSATNASFAAGEIIFIHQSRGTGFGSWEINFIDSYVAGTITTVFDLVNTYTDSGASQAQVIQMPQYSSVTVSGTFTAKDWDGNVGGIIAYLCSGKTLISGTMTATGKGYQNDLLTGGVAQGEGTSGAPSYSTAANGNGSGGGGNAPDGGHVEAAHGAGGGNIAAGTSADSRNTATAATPGSASSNSGLTVMTFGGAGGWGGDGWSSGSGRAGGNGGGIIFILTAELEVSGSMQANGAVGTDSNDRGGAGGGGAGGCIYIATISGVIGTNLITSTGAQGGFCSGAFSGNAGDGANGVVYINSCDISGSSNPSNSGTNAGHDYCQSFISIY